MKKVFLHPIPIRIWHWINAGLIFFLIMSGIQLRFPAVSIFRYEQAALLHKIFGFVLTGSFFYWLIYYLITGGLAKHYMLHIRDAKGMVRHGLLLYFLNVQGRQKALSRHQRQRGLTLCRR